MFKTTEQLEAGDRVALPSGLTRTVSHLEPSPYLNSRNEPIVYVMYAEGRTAEWSAGNSAIASTRWTLADDDACELDSDGWCERIDHNHQGVAS